MSEATSLPTVPQPLPGMTLFNTLISIYWPFHLWEKKRKIFFTNVPSSVYSLFTFVFLTLYGINCCRLQRDSNSDRQSRRRASWRLDHHHYGPLKDSSLRTSNIRNLSSNWFLADVWIYFATIPTQGGCRQAQCFGLRLQSCRPGFESQAHHQCLYHL